MIAIHNLHKHFGGFRAVNGATMTIGEGSLTGLIGPNGAGKTTLFSVVSGRTGRALRPAGSGVLGPALGACAGSKRAALGTRDTEACDERRLP